VDLPELGGVFIGGVNDLFFATGGGIVESSSSAILEFDVLTVDERNPRSEKNQTIEILHGSSAGYGTWSNLPATVSSSWLFEGTRLVMSWRRGIAVILFEWFPEPGRVWINYKVKDIENYTPSTWKGWKGHMPEIT
jgi:hypothetical protein